MRVCKGSERAKCKENGQEQEVCKRKGHQCVQGARVCKVHRVVQGAWRRARAAGVQGGAGR